jgi:glutamate racemase
MLCLQYRNAGMSAGPIAVFDSGLGGLTVVREILRLLPGEDVVYLGDSARVPYGTKSLETVRRFALEDAAFLLSFSPKLLVVACNSASAAAIEALEALSPVPVVDVIRPGSSAALGQTAGAVGVIGTEATVASGAYRRAIREAEPTREVLEVACPLLVPIVEEGRSEDDPIVTHVLCDYLRGLQRRRPGVLVLGCTHYPLLSGAIATLMGPHVPLVNSGRAAAERCVRILGIEPAGNDGGGKPPAPGRLVCYTTDNPERFSRLAERFGGRRPDQTEYVGTDELETRSPERKT